MNKAVTGWAVLSLALLQAAQAQQTELDCSEVRGAQQRLACYDRMAKPAEPPPAPKTREVRMRTEISSEEAAFGIRGASTGAAAREANVSITALVAKVESPKQGILRLTLDNGQVWDQIEVGEQPVIEVGDTVRIVRNAGYRLRRESQGGWTWIRVERAK
jgi:hypothetical protein